MPAGILSAFLFGLLTLSSACYIQNCPRGGKRSIPDTEAEQCLYCGPDNRGKCFGHNICCGKETGCHFATSPTMCCQDENLPPSTCRK